MPKTKTNIYWNNGETFANVQVPKHWKEVYEDGRPQARVGNQHAIHFFGKGKRPQPCGLSECFHCQSGKRRFYRYRTVVIVDGVPLFSDFDSALSRILAETQQKFEEKGVSVSEVQEKIYTISRGEKNERPAYTVTCTGSGTLPESFAVATGMDPQSGTQTVLINEKPGGLATGEPQKDLLKKKTGGSALTKDKKDAPGGTTKKEEPEEPSVLDDLDEPVEKPLDANELEVIKSYEDKIKSQIASKPDWDMAAAIKLALKRKNWTSDRIELAIKCFDKKGNFIAGTA